MYSIFFFRVENVLINSVKNAVEINASMKISIVKVIEYLYILDVRWQNNLLF